LRPQSAGRVRDQSSPLDLTDTVVPGGTYRIVAHENWLAHYAFYSRPEARPHPVTAFIAAQRGMGLSVDELFKILKFDIDDGPLLAECVMDFNHQLREGVDYEITGRIASVERKWGRKLGEFDLVTCVFEVTDPSLGDGPAATVTNTYALPRAGLKHA
jgi:hypothetical protein